MNRAFSPGSITLFFEIRDEKDDPLKIGSRGVGLCISTGMTTSVESGKSLEVYLNNKKLENSIQALVAKKFNFHGTIKSSTSLPISQGFGMSAAAALSTSLAIAKIKNRTYLEAAHVAHIAEIEFKSGLGDVASQYEGGFTIRKKEGIQPYGIVDRVFYPNLPITLVLLEKGIETKSVLTDKTMRKYIKKVGYLTIEKFLKAPSLNNAIKLAREFSIKTGLISEEGKNLLDECENSVISMIGNSGVIFGTCKKDIIDEYKTYDTNISSRARILN